MFSGTDDKVDVVENHTIPARYVYLAELKKLIPLHNSSLAGHLLRHPAPAHLLD